MSTRNTIQSRAVQLALAEKGYKEGRRNWNKFARDSYPDVQNQAWCGSFVGDIYRRAGWDSRGLVWMPYVPYIESWAKKIGAWKTSRAQAGDIVIYGFGRTSGQHTGIAYPDESTGGDSYRAIEGNTSSGNSGSQSNGDGVYVRYRTRRDIRGWVDMAKVLRHYGVQDEKAAAVNKPSTKPKPAKSGDLVVDGKLGPETAKRVQAGLGVKQDGIIGPKTIRAWQEKYGTPVDGKITGQGAAARPACPAIRKDCLVEGSGGSRLVRAVQQRVGMTGRDVDGKLGPDTVRALQRHQNKVG